MKAKSVSSAALFLLDSSLQLASLDLRLSHFTTSLKTNPEGREPQKKLTWPSSQSPYPSQKHATRDSSAIWPPDPSPNPKMTSSSPSSTSQPQLTPQNLLLHKPLLLARSQNK